MNFQEANAEALPFANGFFDLVTVFTVCTSILDPQMARNVSREIHRVLRSGGAVVWYDFRMNNPSIRMCAASRAKEFAICSRNSVRALFRSRCCRRWRGDGVF